MIHEAASIMNRDEMIRPVDSLETTNLDEKNVIKHFLGLTQLEATKMIVLGEPYPCTVYTEDLMWMSDEGFTYYFPSFVAACQIVLHLKGEEYAEDLCSGVLTAVSFRADVNPDNILNNKKSVMELLRLLESETDELIDDYQRDKLVTIKKLLKNL